MIVTMVVLMVAMPMKVMAAMAIVIVMVVVVAACRTDRKRTDSIVPLAGINRLVKTKLKLSKDV